MKTLLITIFCVSNLISLSAQADTMKNVTYPYEVHYLSLKDSLQLAYFDEGQGNQTLILIHGLGSYAPAWFAFMEELKTDYRCIAVDLPGYGKSSYGNFPYSMSFFAEAVQQLIQQLGIENPVVVGHSMGGQVAMTLALQQPEWLQKLVLIAPAGFETFSETDHAFIRQLMTPEAVEATPPDRIRINFAVNFHQMQFPESAMFMYADRMSLREDTAAYRAYCQMIPQCVQSMLEEPVFDRLSEIETRTQVIYGKGDLLIPNKILHPDLTVEKVAASGIEKLPNAQLELIENCGHFVQWECAEEVATIVRKFLSN